MEDLQRFVKTLWRWKWLLISFVLVSVTALNLKLHNVEPLYHAELTLQITTPDQKEIQLVDQYRFVSVQEDLTLARNTLIEVVNSSEIYKQTIAQLNLKGEDADYKIGTEFVQDTDFIHASVEARSPQLAAEIVNAHIDNAVNRFGELRAMTSTTSKDYFFDQLQMAEENLRIAEAAFVEFRTTNEISSLEDELKVSQQTLEELRLELDRLPTDEANGEDGERHRLAGLLKEREARIEQLVALEPEFNLWSTNVQEARETYQHLLDKYTEALLKEGLAKTVGFIQVVSPAAPPTYPINNVNNLFMLTIVGSIGSGILLVFFLDYFLGAKPEEKMTASVPITQETDQQPNPNEATILKNGQIKLHPAQPICPPNDANHSTPINQPNYHDPIDHQKNIGSEKK